jgi:hypothetical protein
MSDTITTIEYLVIAIIFIMVSLILVLMTMLIVSDSKHLMSLMKAIGFRDHRNAESILSIYVPILLLGVIFSIPLSYGLVGAFNAIIFSGMKIMLLTSIN